MRARKVKGLNPNKPLSENGARIVSVRLRELCSFAEEARDPDEARAQHDMRIAAKRLRYVLELLEPCFSDVAREAAKEARRLQDLLGDIHDCDEMLPRAHAHLATLRERDAQAVTASSGLAKDLEPRSVGAAPNRAHYQGIESLITYVTARRAVLHGGLVRKLDRLELNGLAKRLREEVRDAS
ncbi:MAG: CHAD domain-containing protein [Solirubrobacteraceae bacterium]